MENAKFVNHHAHLAQTVLLIVLVVLAPLSFNQIYVELLAKVDTMLITPL